MSPADEYLRKLVDSCDTIEELEMLERIATRVDQQLPKPATITFWLNDEQAERFRPYVDNHSGSVKPELIPLDQNSDWPNGKTFALQTSKCDQITVKFVDISK